MAEPRPTEAPAPVADEIAGPLRSKPLQFSMRTLLIVTTVVAVVAALAPGSIVVRILLYVILDFAPLICFVTGAIYARGSLQTFFIGASCVAITNPHTSLAYMSGRASDFVISIAWVFFQYPIGGGLAVLARRAIERRGWHLPPGAVKK